MMTIEELVANIRTVPDYPMKGILFYDVTTLFKNPEALHTIVEMTYELYKDKGITKVVGIESRGFVLGSALAVKLGAGFVLARKPGKLPYTTVSYQYGLEYGTDELHMHVDSVKPGQRVAVVDDLLATGGTALACARLCEKAGGVVAACCFAIELTDLPGRETLKNYDVETVLKY